MKRKQTRLMVDVLRVQSASFNDGRMRRFVKAFADAHGIECREHKGNLYLTKGRASVYPCLVAHLDTVHDVLPPDQYMVVEDEGVWFGWNPVKKDYTGVGGDDKVGIFIALQLATELPAVKVALFRDEEVGCMGAYDADKDFFADCAFAIEADRKGSGDFVTEIGSTQLQSREFRDAVAPILTRHGYKESWGMMTDVQTLARTHRIPIAMANLSCGYHNPHTSKEYVVEHEVGNALSLVRTICRELGDRIWEVHRPAYTPPTYGNWSSPWTYDWKKPGKAEKAEEEEEAFGDALFGVGFEEGVFVPEFCTVCGSSQVDFDPDLNRPWCWACMDYLPAEESPEPVALLLG